MSIASEITRLQNAKAAIKAAIETKGVTVGDETLDEYADLIDEIDTGETEKNFLKGIIDRTITSIASTDWPEGIIRIGDYSFTHCQSLTTVVIPNTIISYGSNIFQDCTNLINITLPENIQILTQSMFQGCKALQSIFIPNSVTSFISYVFADCDNLETINIPNIISIGTQCFKNCKKITSIELPSTLQNINANAFVRCETLNTVIVRAITPPTLGTNVFNNNASGRKIYVPAASVNAYKTATNWSAYANDIEAIPTNS